MAAKGEDSSMIGAVACSGCKGTRGIDGVRCKVCESIVSTAKACTIYPSPA